MVPKLIDCVNLRNIKKAAINKLWGCITTDVNYVLQCLSSFRLFFESYNTTHPEPEQKLFYLVIVDVREMEGCGLYEGFAMQQGKSYRRVGNRWNVL